MLEEEKRVIMALRRGVETQDYVAVKSLLQQAEVMGLSGEEVKQAQAMRLRIEVRSGMSPWLSANIVDHVARLGGRNPASLTRGCVLPRPLATVCCRYSQHGPVQDSILRRMELRCGLELWKCWVLHRGK